MYKYSVAHSRKIVFDKKCLKNILLSKVHIIVEVNTHYCRNIALLFSVIVMILRSLVRGVDKKILCLTNIAHMVIGTATHRNYTNEDRHKMSKRRCLTNIAFMHDHGNRYRYTP